MKPKVGIIGNGNVGSALARGLERAGCAVRAVGSDPAKVKEMGEWSEVVILAVPDGCASVSCLILNGEMSAWSIEYAWKAKRRPIPSHSERR